VEKALKNKQVRKSAMSGVRDEDKIEYQIKRERPRIGVGSDRLYSLQTSVGVGDSGCGGAVSFSSAD
jgi:hypothetical protein